MSLKPLKALQPIVLAVCCCCLSSCASLITSTVIKPAVGNLQQQTDIKLVCEGAPSYLLMLDSMLVPSPDSEGLLLVATQSYSAYAAALEECSSTEERVAAIAKKAHFYGHRLLEHYLPLQDAPDQGAFDRALANLKTSAVPEVFWGTYGWLTWVKSQKGSPASIADMVEIQKIMARLLELDESYQGGSIHLFFGMYYAAKPAMFGGDPERSTFHFEKALALSDRKFLPVQTIYAEMLTRMTMDQELHDNLLQEVLAFPAEDAPEFGLSNQMAKKKAKRLLDENYFGE